MPTDSELASIIELGRQIDQLASKSVHLNAPIVDELIRSKSQEINDIERALDRLLDFAFEPSVLGLFRRLCRYYWTIDPHATTTYIQAYREMWDAQSLEPSQTTQSDD